MRNVEKLKQAPFAITLAGWGLVYSWMFSMAGLGLSISTVFDLAEQQALAERFAMAMGLYLVMAALVSSAVYLWAIARWMGHFLANARRYGLVDIALAPVVGVGLAATSVLLLAGSQ
jgi:hypothetical protein